MLIVFWTFGIWWERVRVISLFSSLFGSPFHARVKYLASIDIVFLFFYFLFFFFFTLRYLQSNIIIPCEIVMKEICFQGTSYVYHRFILPISRDIAILGVQYYGQNIYFSIFSKWIFVSFKSNVKKFVFQRFLSKYTRHVYHKLDTLDTLFYKPQYRVKILSKFSINNNKKQKIRICFNETAEKSKPFSN